jgi:hypothetical protein
MNLTRKLIETKESKWMWFAGILIVLRAQPHAQGL